VRRFAQFLFFLVWVDEARSAYSKYLFSPFHWVRDYLLEPILKFRPLDVMLLALLALAVAKGAFRVRTVRPVKRTLLGALGVTVLALVYGLATGGDSRAAGWQSYLPMSVILATFAIAATHHTAEHFTGLLKVFVLAGVVHAVMCVIFHVFYVKAGSVTPLPDYEGTHDDTVIWTSSIGLLLLFVMQYPTTRNRIVVGLLLPLILAAIQFNRRRLAWVSLIAALVTLYFVLPASKTKRRIQRAVAIALPVMLLYVVVGWGRTEGVFRPLRSFETVSVEEDNSTKARDMENLGLIATGTQYGWLLGSGLGHKYVEVSNKYQIYFFELWPYVPHNSVLGLFAYGGYVGFLGFWMLFPMSAFFHARVARQARRPLDRNVAAVAIMQLVACADQWYGDMGSFSPVTMYTLAATLAMALRLPIASGVWSNAAGSPRPVQAPAQPA
jgi:hypothetical protein